jgi:hypothetical protein
MQEAPARSDCETGTSVAEDRGFELPFNLQR